MALNPAQDSEREQERAAAINHLRSGKQFILLCTDAPPGVDNSDELVHFHICGDVQFSLNCADHLSRYVMEITLAPEAFGVQDLGEQDD